MATATLNTHPLVGSEALNAAATIGCEQDARVLRLAPIEQSQNAHRSCGVLQPLSTSSSDPSLQATLRRLTKERSGSEACVIRTERVEQIPRGT